jgi:glycosyltransferase involved in cell wall biosynthesis
MEALKIAITTEFFYPSTGGAEQSALELAKALSRRGHDVVVFTAGSGEREVLEEFEIRRSFKALRALTMKRDVPVPRIVDRIEKKHLVREIGDNEFDILHSNNRDTAVFTAETGRELNIPVVAHIRDFWPLCPKRDFLRPEGICPEPRDCASCMAAYFRAWHKTPIYVKMWRDTGYRFKAISRHVNGYIYNSSYTSNRIGLGPGRVIFNAVNLDHISRRRTIPGKVLYIGNVTRRKGIALLVRAIRDLDVTLHIVGDGYLLPDIQGKNIVKHGRLDYLELLEHLSDAEMLVVPSIWPEPFGRVAVEGMAAGLPVVATPVGGLSEVVGNSGIILRNVDVVELQNAIRNMHEDIELQKKFGRMGYNRSRMFSPDIIAKETVEFYKELMV